jgi:hypothetical protein
VEKEEQMRGAEKIFRQWSQQDVETDPSGAEERFFAEREKSRVT